MHHARIAKPDLGFLRMHVNVHTLRRQLQVQHEGRMPAVVKHILVCLAHRVGDQSVLHGASIDEEKLLVGLRPVVARFGHPAVQLERTTLLIDLQNVGALCCLAVLAIGFFM